MSLAVCAVTRGQAGNPNRWPRLSATNVRQCNVYEKELAGVICFYIAFNYLAFSSSQLYFTLELVSSMGMKMDSLALFVYIFILIYLFFIYFLLFPAR